MRPLHGIVSLLILIGSTPALADVVTLVGLDACPAPGMLVSGPGRMVTVEGAGATDSTALACFPDDYVSPGAPRLMSGIANWLDICLPQVNCSGGSPVTRCVVCNYPDQSFAAAPAVSVLGLGVLVSALLGAAYYQRRARSPAGRSGAAARR